MVVTAANRPADVAMATSIVGVKLKKISPAGNESQRMIPLPEDTTGKVKPLTLEDISAVSLINTMSLQQLIGILRNYNIDTRGFVNKNDYEDAVLQLWLKQNRYGTLDRKGQSLGQQPIKKPPYKSVSLEDIFAPNEVDLLTIGQLKEILKKNSIDPWLYNEKDELVHIVVNLWNEHQKAKGRTTSVPATPLYKDKRDPKVLSLKDIPSATAITKLSNSQLKAIVNKYSPHWDNSSVDREQLINEVIVMWQNKTPSLCDINLIDDVYRLDNNALKEILRKNGIDSEPYKEKAELRFVVARLWYSNKVKVTGSVKSLNLNDAIERSIRSSNMTSSSMAVGALSPEARADLEKFDSLLVMPPSPPLPPPPPALEAAAAVFVTPERSEPLSLRDITSVDEIRGLHFRLMKAILDYHSVDTTSLRDKEEMRKKLIELWLADKMKKAEPVKSYPVLTTVKHQFEPVPSMPQLMQSGHNNIPYIDEDRSEASSISHINTFNRSSVYIDHRIKNPNASYRKLSQYSRSASSLDDDSHADKVKQRLLSGSQQSSSQQRTTVAITETTFRQDQSQPPPITIQDIISEDDCEKLTIGQTKMVLSQNAVDFTQCTERRELTSLLVRLWRDVHSRGSGVGVANGGSCANCLVSPIDCVLLNCGHMVTCMNCGVNLKRCPVCQSYVIRAVKAYSE